MSSSVGVVVAVLVAVLVCVDVSEVVAEVVCVVVRNVELVGGKGRTHPVCLPVQATPFNCMIAIQQCSTPPSIDKQSPPPHCPQIAEQHVLPSRDKIPDVQNSVWTISSVVGVVVIVEVCVGVKVADVVESSNEDVDVVELVVVIEVVDVVIVVVVVERVVVVLVLVELVELVVVELVVVVELDVVPGHA